MVYLGGWISFANEDERVDVGITAGRLRELLSQIDAQVMIRVNPITRNLLLDDGRYIDLIEETIEVL